MLRKLLWKNGVLLQSLPYRDDARLVNVWSYNTRENLPRNPISPANFLDFQKMNTTLDGLQGYFTFVTPTAARAAGAAYQVDTSEVSEAGNCKVESWVSSADNRDFFAAVTPTCAFEGLRPYELSAQFSRTRQDFEWSTGLAPKLKVNLAPSGIGVFGWAVEAKTFFDYRVLFDLEETTVVVHRIRHRREAYD